MLYVPAAVHDPASGGDGLNLEHIIDAPESLEPEWAQRDEVAALCRKWGEGVEGEKLGTWPTQRAFTPEEGIKKETPPNKLHHSE